MGKILEAFLVGQLCVDNGCRRETPKNQGSCARGDGLRKRFRNRNKVGVRRRKSAECACFVCGFGLMAMLACEISMERGDE